MKKEREIIEMIEKEEKSRDVPYLISSYKKNEKCMPSNSHYLPRDDYKISLGNEKFKRPFVPPVSFE